MAVETIVEREAHDARRPADAGSILTGQPAREGPAGARRIVMARRLVQILAKTIDDPSALAIELDVPNRPAPVRPLEDRPRATVRVQGPDAVARLLWPPTPDAFGDAFLRGDLEIDGEVMAAVEAGSALDPRRLSLIDLRRAIRWTTELRRGAQAGRRIGRLARLVGARHSRARDMAAIRFHYDVGEAFYSLWLDHRMTYSCAYFERPDDPAADLHAAQEAKIDLICRKLALAPGRRLLDIGCGWGSLITFAAERYGVEAVGVTLSQRQADEANRRATDAGLGHLVRAEVRDYRDMAALGSFDAVASVGMFEHVGAANLASYFRAAFAALRPGGLFLNHGIGHARRPARVGLSPRPATSHFVDRYVFPDGELVPVERALAVLRASTPFEPIDVQLLGPHYALTLAAWVARLEANWEAAVAAAGDEVARTWRLYMSAARLGFERGHLDVAQVLATVPSAGAAARPPLRPWW